MDRTQNSVEERKKNAYGIRGNSLLRTKCNRDNNGRKDNREKNLRTVGGGCYSLKIFPITRLL